jgi:hypothetical protein
LRGPGWTVRTTSPLALARALFRAGIREVPGDENRALVGLVRRRTRERIDPMIRRRFAHPVTGRVHRDVYHPVDSAGVRAGIAAAVADALRQRPLSDDPIGVRDAALLAARELTRGPLRPSWTHAAPQARNRAVPDDWLAWTLHLAGQWELGWCAYASYLAAIDDDPGHRDWRRVAVIADALSAGWWWPHLDFQIVCDRPSVVHTEPTPDGPARPHSDDGPAIVWPDGWSLYFWHGTLVPAWVVLRPTVAAIHAESNVEVRRCGIESLGWDAYISAARLRLVDRSDDPGNPDCGLWLYDLPEGVWGTASRVLLVTNGSPERDGTRRRYGLPVPADLDTAVRAAAWTYGLDADQYARLTRRT